MDDYFNRKYLEFPASYIFYIYLIQSYHIYRISIKLNSIRRGRGIDLKSFHAKKSIVLSHPP